MYNFFDQIRIILNTVINFLRFDKGLKTKSLTTGFYTV